MERNSNPPKLLLNFGVPLFYRMGNEDTKGYIKGQSGRNIVKNLFSESNFSLSILDFNILKTILIKRDQNIINDFCSAIQEVLHNVYFHCTNEYPEYNKYFIKNKNLQLQSIITTALSLIPITEPDNNSEIIVPQFIDGKWQKIWFKIERIRVTPMQFSTPYYAYGLIPIQDSHGALPTNTHAHILFMSTNPMPTASGSHHTIMSDTVPGCSAGEHLYLIGSHQIHQFINKLYKATKLPVIAIGQSLGGSIAVISHVYQPDKVLAIAINPPMWLSNLQKTYRKKLAETKNRYNLKPTIGNRELFDHIYPNKDPIVIFTNKRDPVFNVGNYIPEHSKIWQISSNIGNNYSYFSIHNDCFAAHSAANTLKFDKICPVIENQKLIRTYVTIGWRIISVPLMILHITVMLLKAALHFIISLATKLISNLNTSTVQKPVRHFQDLTTPVSPLISGKDISNLKYSGSVVTNKPS